MNYLHSLSSVHDVHISYDRGDGFAIKSLQSLLHGLPVFIRREFRILNNSEESQLHLEEYSLKNNVQIETSVQLYLIDGQINT